MNTERCSLKLRVFTLVVNTADFINERATPTLGMSHALIAPIAIFTTYIFLGIFVIGGLKQQHASWFLQIYALLVCSSIEISLSFTVFKHLKTVESYKKNAAMILNGILPMIIAIILFGDLIAVTFSVRPVILPPSIISSARTESPPEIRTEMQNNLPK